MYRCVCAVRVRVRGGGGGRGGEWCWVGLVSMCWCVCVVRVVCVVLCSVVVCLSGCVLCVVSLKIKWSSTASSGKGNDWRTRECVVLDLVLKP